MNTTLNESIELTKRAVLVPAAVGTFELPLGHGTPYHKFVVTLENATLVYHAFSYGVPWIDEHHFFHVKDAHVGDTPGGLETFLKAPPAKVLGAGVVHVTGGEDEKCLSSNTIGSKPFVYPSFDSSDPEMIPAVPIVVFEQLLPCLVEEYGKLFSPLTTAMHGGRMPPLWELWEGIVHPLYLKAVKDLAKNAHQINSIGCQASWRL